MRERRLVVANAMDDRHLPVLEQPFEADHRLLKAELVVDPQQVVLPDAQLGTGVVIGVIGKGDDGVEAVIAARQFDDDEDAVVGPRLLLRHFRPDGRRRDTARFAQHQAAEALLREAAPFAGGQ